MAIGGRPQAKVTNLVETFGENVLEKASDELLGIQCHRFPLGIVCVFIAEGDACIVEGKDASVGDGDALKVPSEVLQHFVSSGEGGLGVDDPFGATGGVRDCDVWQLLAEAFEEDGAEDFGEGFDGDEEVFACREPSRAIR